MPIYFGLSVGLSLLVSLAWLTWFTNGQLSFFPQIAYTVDPKPSWVVVADVNNDTYLDICASSGSSNAVSILLGYGMVAFNCLIRLLRFLVVLEDLLLPT